MNCWARIGRGIFWRSDEALRSSQDDLTAQNQDTAAETLSLLDGLSARTMHFRTEKPIIVTVTCASWRRCRQKLHFHG